MSSNRRQKINNIIQLAANAEQHRIQMQKLSTPQSVDSEISQSKQSISYIDKDITENDEFKSNHPFLYWLFRGNASHKMLTSQKTSIEEKIKNLEAKKPAIEATLDLAKSTHQKLVQTFVDAVCKLKGDNNDENIKKIAAQAYEHASNQKNFESELIYKLNAGINIPLPILIANKFSIGVKSTLLNRNTTDTLDPMSFAFIFAGAILIALSLTLAPFSLPVLLMAATISAGGLVATGLAIYAERKISQREKTFAKAIKPDQVSSTSKLSTTAALGFVSAQPVNDADMANATMAQTTSTHHSSPNSSSANNNIQNLSQSMQFRS